MRKRLRVDGRWVNVEALLRVIDLRSIIGVERMLCPWHNDTVTPNLVIYPDHAYCFACEKWASPFEIVMEVFDLGFVEAARYIIRHKGREWHTHTELPPISPDTYLTQPHHRLMALGPASVAWTYLCGRGIGPNVAKKFMLGCTKQEITIPHIVDSNLINIKYRMIPELGIEGQLTYRSLSGRPLTALWPHDEILQYDSEILILAEGEFDAMVLWDAGLPAASIPHGVNGRLAQWYSTLSLFKEVWVTFDQDEAADAAWQRFLTKPNKHGYTDEQLLAPVVFKRIQWNKQRGKDVTAARKWIIPRFREMYDKTKST